MDTPLTGDGRYRLAPARTVKKHSLLGVRIAATDYEEAVDRIVDAARKRQPLGVTALAVHGVMTGALDPVQRFRLNALDMCVPDGQPVRWALNSLYGAGLPDRVYGPELMLRTCVRAAKEGLAIYLYGSSGDVLESLARNLTKKIPNLRIAGSSPSRFRKIDDREKQEVVRKIRESGASVVFCGLGCPRQEVWAYEYRDAIGLPIIAVGAAFDFFAGRIPQAPPALQRRGLEWAFRLYNEPRRLWRRYLLLNPLYVSMVLAQSLGVKRFDDASDARPTADVGYG